MRVNQKNATPSQRSEYKFKTPAEVHKKRIFDVVNQLNEEELEKVSEMLKLSEKMDNADDDLDVGAAADGDER